MKKNYKHISEQYLEEVYIKETIGMNIARAVQGAGQAAASPTMGSMIASAAAGSLAFAVPGQVANLAIQGAMSAAKMIAQIKKKHEWKSEGCDHILDDNEKFNCEIVNLDAQSREINSIQRECMKMKNPMECRQRIMEEIMKLKQKRMELMQKKNEALRGGPSGPDGGQQ